MTTEQLPVNQVEASEVLQELIDSAETMASRYRDPNLPEGALLGEIDTGEGQMVRFRKPSSMVRAGRIALPERFQVWDKFGNDSWVPTAMRDRMLSKPRADAQNERAFHAHIRGTRRASSAEEVGKEGICRICPPSKQPIDAICGYCTGPKGQKNCFFTEQDFINHKRRLHPDEFEAEERMLERSERRAQTDAQNRVAEALIATMQSQRPAEPPTPEPATHLFACDQCDRAFETDEGLRIHVGRAHKPGGE